MGLKPSKNPFIWILGNPAETILISIFPLSLLPLFMEVKSPAMLGGFIVVLAAIAERIWSYKKRTTTYSIALIILLAFGVVSLMCIGNKPYYSLWTPFQNMLSIYLGGFWAMMMSEFMASYVESERKKKAAILEQERIAMEYRRQQEEMSRMEREGWIAIRKGGKLLGYIEKDKYELFVNSNIKKV